MCDVISLFENEGEVMGIAMTNGIEEEIVGGRACEKACGLEMACGKSERGGCRDS